MVGIDVMMSLLGLHCLMVRVKCVAYVGGRMNMRFLDWETLMHEL